MFEKSENWCIILLEMVEGVIVMIIGTILIAVALHGGIVLTVDLFNNLHHSTSTQSNHS